MIDLSPTQQVSHWLTAFEQALAKGDVAQAAAMFDADSYWRDLVAFTWNIKTCEGQAAIADMLGTVLAGVQPSNWRLEGEASQANGLTEAWFTFETAAARGLGQLRLKGDKCWTLLTTMAELKDFPERKGPARALGTIHGVVRGRKNWLDHKTEEEAALGYSRQPYCLIIGGGQCGIALAARLRRLDVPTIVIERQARAGDSWRNRYKSLCLHDPVWYDHLPYLPFPDDWPVFAPKDKIGDWLEMYTKVMEINYWASTECKSAQYDEAAGQWTVNVERAGQPVTLRPTQLVLATGIASFPNLVRFPGAERFKGVQHHSSRHPGGDGYAGKDCIVIGSNNSAHDISADLWEHGANVTMVQRSSTLVAKSETLMELGLGDLYSERALSNGISTDKADLIFASLPYKVLPALQVPVYQEMARRDADLYERLKKVGFKLDFGEDDSGVFMKAVRRGGGYYIDVGASELVATGKIKLKSGVTVKEIKEHSVLFSDGTELPADLIVYATGYGSMDGWIAQLISQQVADKVGLCWGLGSGTTRDPGPWEGELRNMWKPTRQPGLWLHGGNLHLSRHYSQFLALQLKARMENLPTPVYGMNPVPQTA
ncbi:NAD(P)/FAD-dependent oxidoreductase [Verminephrobacter eiseniae]|uniref:NAD(P)/FAD-dependent oxidoreductase n=1 Tax=Verminephrobacter eiseniae TaxID=364317 RepID=UPI0022386257|nr:NAD(P)/FAD-dependent oxidoreductase [Verminephrobacter eiseniae]MCW5238580.1 NAD(P)/FAD-dependent oxidoreductase [Verminephrobacter eiseniae]